MAAHSQPSVKEFFSKVNSDEFHSQNHSRPTSFIQPVTKDEQKEYQKGRKRQNMRDLRDRRKVKDIAEGRRDSEGKVIKDYPDALDMLNRIEGEDENYSHAMSSSTNNLRPLTRKRKQIENSDGEKETHIQSRVRKNWFHPHIWPAIDQAARKTNFSPRETIACLQSRYRNTRTYDDLRPSTIENWIDRTTPKRKWMERVNALVTEGTCWKRPQTFRSILDGQSELITEIKASLLAIRQASLTVNANLARVIILGLIQATSPDLLGDRASYRPKGQAPVFSTANY